MTFGLENLLIFGKFSDFYCTSPGVYRWRTRGHNSPDAESLREPKKSQQCHKHFVQYSAFASERPQVRTWGCQTCFLLQALSNLITPLHITPVWSRTSQMADRGPNPDLLMVKAGPRQPFKVLSVYRSFHPKILRLWPYSKSNNPRQ